MDNHGQRGEFTLSLSFDFSLTEACARTQLYRLQDRRGSEYLLGPTHEEEVTRLVSDEVHSGRALPVRVFQISKFKQRRESRYHRAKPLRITQPPSIGTSRVPGRVCSERAPS